MEIIINGGLIEYCLIIIAAGIILISGMSLGILVELCKMKKLKADRCGEWKPSAKEESVFDISFTQPCKQ